MKENMITYKLVKVENLKLEKTVELTDKQLDIIRVALQELTSLYDDITISLSVDDDIVADEVLHKLHQFTV
jgi:hypothetical protein